MSDISLTKMDSSANNKKIAVALYGPWYLNHHSFHRSKQFIDVACIMGKISFIGYFQSTCFKTIIRLLILVNECEMEGKCL